MQLPPHKYRKWIEKKCDEIYSEFVRRRDNGVCFTCGTRGDWKQMQCGHFMRRGCHSVRWDLNNGRCQCQICNETHGGRPAVFERNLRVQVGDKEVDRVILASKQTKKYLISGLEKTKQFLTNLLQRYESRN